jgi:hypothetical protein
MVGNGAVDRSNPNKQKAHHKDAYILRFNATQTRWVLPQLLPYLRRKRAQADLVLRHFASLDTLGRRDLVGQQEREELYRQCHDLNRRGIPI